MKEEEAEEAREGRDPHPQPVTEEGTVLVPEHPTLLDQRAEAQTVTAMGTRALAVRRARHASHIQYRSSQTLRNHNCCSTRPVQETALEQLEQLEPVNGLLVVPWKGQETQAPDRRSQVE